jgi:tripartite motif-containing protein 71
MGHVWSKWGTSGTGDGEFIRPDGVAVASDGCVYVSDTNNFRIRKFTSEGVFVSKWGTEGSGDGEFNQPYGAAVASDGSVYVVDSRNNRIQKFSVGQ